VNTPNHYDYIIIGGGASGLSLGVALCDPFFQSKKILIIEKENKNTNDRTWSSWVKEDDKLNFLATHIWPGLDFFSEDGKLIKLYADPYIYRIIRSADFYKYAHDILRIQSNVTLVREEYTSYEVIEGEVLVHTTKSKYYGKHVFSSIPKVLPDKSELVYVDQHFKGWFIETPKAAFDNSSCYFMDFRTPQEGETRFLYMLPITDKKALVQVAIFSNDILSSEGYDVILKNYIDDHLKIGEYEIKEEEIGVIPMTTYNFAQFDTPFITHIGASSGCVKPSSGYAFSRIQLHTESIVNSMKRGQSPSNGTKIFSKKYVILDDTMLDVVIRNKVSGATFFTELFKRNKASRVFSFLDGTSSLAEEIQIMNLPFKWPFITSFIKSLFRAITKKI
jgi:lycopene beta-cyclase